MTRYGSVRLLLLGLVALAFELTVAEKLSFLGGRAEPLLVLACFGALFARDRPQGLWVAWTLGLAKDLGGASPLGLHALLFLGIAWALLGLRRFVFREHPLMQLLIASVAALVVNLPVAAFACVSAGSIPLGLVLAKSFAGSLLTGVLAPAVMGILLRRRSFVRPNG